MSKEDLIQWITLGVILLIAIFVIIKRIIRFRRSLQDGSAGNCGCGCPGCDRYCEFADKTTMEDGE